MNRLIARKEALLGLFATLAGCAGGGLLTTGPTAGRRSPQAVGSPAPGAPMVAAKTTGATPPFSTALGGGTTWTDSASGVRFQSGSSAAQPYVNAFTSDGTFVYQHDFASTGSNGMPYFRVTTTDGQCVTVLLPDITGVGAGSVMALGAGYTLTVDPTGYRSSITNGSNTYTCAIDGATTVATMTRNGSQLPTVQFSQYATFAGAVTPGGGMNSKCAGILGAIACLMMNIEALGHAYLLCAEAIFPPAIAACTAAITALEIPLIAALLYLLWQLSHCNDKPSPSPSASPSPRATATVTATAHPA